MTNKIAGFVTVPTEKNKKIIQFFRERLSGKSVSEVQAITPKGIAGTF